MILQVVLQNFATVNVCRSAACDCGACWIAELDYLRHTPGCVFRGNPLNLRMRREETFALGQRNRMRLDTLDSVERCARTTDEMVSYGDDHFSGNVQRTFQKKIIRPVNGPGQAVFNWSENVIGCSFVNRDKERLEGWARNELDVFAQ